MASRSFTWLAEHNHPHGISAAASLERSSAVFASVSCSAWAAALLLRGTDSSIV